MHVHTSGALDADLQGRDSIEVEPLDPQEALALQRELQRFQDDAHYYDAHRTEYLEKYPEHWVAIYCKHVVATARQHQELLRELTALGIPVGRTFREYVCDDDVDFIIGTL